MSVEACGVGLTVLNCIRGDLATATSTTPRIPGHEYVGRIVDIGSGVDCARVGERVAAYFYLFCGRCRRCLSGGESLCERLGGYVGVDVDGGYAPLAVLPERNAVPLPDELEALSATAVPDAIATPVHIARRAGIAAGERVVVIGAGGGVGIHMVQVAQLHGAAVLGLESAARKREALGRELDVDTADSSRFDELELPSAWRRGADVVIDLLGSEHSQNWALDAVRENGRVVALTTFRGVAASVSPRQLVSRQIALLGSRYAGRHELALAAELVMDGRIRPFVTAAVTVEDVEALHERLRGGELLGRGAVVWRDQDRAMRRAAP